MGLENLSTIHVLLFYTGPNLIFKPGIIQYKIVEIGEKDDKLIKMIEFDSSTNYLSNDELKEKIIREFGI